MIKLQQRRVRNVSNFWKSDHLLIETKSNEILILGADRSMITNGGVRIVTKNIDDISAWIPARSHRIPEPDQVVKTMVVRVAIKHESVKCLAALWAPGTPPEPSPIGLVQWSP